MISDGLYPIADKNKKIPIINFVEAASLFLETKLEGLKSQRHKAQWPSILNRCANPLLGKLALVASQLIMFWRFLSPIWITKIETASHLRELIEAILSWRL